MQRTTERGLTPSQTVGPFFAYGLTPNGKYNWNDAFTNNLITADTSGERIRVEGRVFLPFLRFVLRRFPIADSGGFHAAILSRDPHAASS